ncbi:MAG: hypothetical protein QOF48_1949 [Verrucomicrobiota bacterium]
MHRAAFWLGVGMPIFAIVMTSISPGTMIGPLMWNVALFQIVLVFSTLAHEVGHALAARLAGFYVSHIEVGLGRKFLEFRLWGFRWLFRAVPVGGMAHAAPRDARWWRLRMTLFILGGPAANVLLIIGAWIFATFRDAPPSGMLHDIAPVTVVVLANAPLLIYSLWPHEARSSRGNLANDGLLIWRTWHLKRDDIAGSLVAVVLYEVQELRHQGKLDAADACLDRGLQRFPSHPTLETLRGILLFDRGLAEDSRRIWIRLLGRYSGDEQVRFAMFNNIAYADILIGDPDLLWEADAGSRLALERQPWMAAFKGTRGMVLVELGDLDAGLKLLHEAFHEQDDKKNQALDACYIGIAHSRGGDAEQCRSFFALARRLDPGCCVLAREPRLSASAVKLV